MASPESVAALLSRAEDCLRTAEEILEKDDGRTGVIAYHITQYVEKTIKFKLIELDITFPRTHDIEKLLKLFPDEALSKRQAWHAAVLHSFESIRRHDEMPPTLKDVKFGLICAKNIVAEVSEIKP
ncbi:MAG: HEPN domain-containing protein [Candidatus Methanoplasma sp.]|jgi:hypothetical protein|nr:HEPN domain-containing protein [Candidatus Methanoplasma sp.]